MRLGSALLPLLALALLAGCGDVSRRATEDEPDPRGARPAAPTLGETPSSRPLGCAFDLAAPDRAVLAWPVGPRLLLVRPDGTSLVAHTFGAPEGAPDEADPSIYTSAAGDHVVASALTYAGGSESWQSVLLDRTGEVLWRGETSPHAYHPAYVAAHGAVAFRRYTLTSALVVWPDGTSRAYPGVEPVAAPGADGTLLVRDLEHGGATVTLDLATGALGEPAAPAKTLLPLAEGATALPVDGGLVYVADVGDALVLAVDRDGGTLTLPSPTASPVLEAVTPAGVALVASTESWWADPRWLADVGAGLVTPVTPLGDLFPFGYGEYDGGPMLDASTGVLGVLRDGARGGLFRDTGDGGWAPIGGTYRDVWDIGHLRRHGTFVITGSDREGYFGMTPWEDGAADLAGPVTQVARASDGAWASLGADIRGVAIAGDGQCVAFVEADGAGATLRAFDVAAMSAFDVLAIDDASPGLPVWFGGPSAN